jgi:transposase
MDLELQAEEEAIESAPQPPPDKPKGGSRKGRKTRAALLPDHLPIEETVLIPEEVKSAPENWRRIGEEVAERLERIPGRFVRQRLVRPVYVSVEQPYAPPVTAPAPPQLVPGGFFGHRMMADMAINKYLYHQPLYRQAKAIEHESGIVLSAATMCQTIARIADAVAPVVRCMAQQMWQSPCVQIDLTPVRCLSRERDGGSIQGHMWVSAVPGGDVLYTWDKSKEALVAERIIPENFRGVLQCDGGSEIACFLKGGKTRNRPPPQITRAACWAHVRRKFFEAAKGTAGCPIAARLLIAINILYRIERQARERQFTPADLQALRQQRSRRVVAALHRRLIAVRDSERPRSPVGRAVLYALGQWDALQVYLQNGHVPIDDNSVENAIRPCALGRKNWLFIGDVGAGQRSAILYSLLGSCLRRRINPRAYLHWLFDKLPVTTNLQVHTLTPAAYAREHGTSDNQQAA